MSRIVIYQSYTGFTKQYAQWIAEELDCQVASLKEVSTKEVEQYDQVIYGGWVMGGTIIDLDKIKEMKPKELIVFAVGSTPAELIDVDKMKDENKLETENFFYLQGGFRFEKINFFLRTMLKTMGKSVAKKEEKTPQDEFMVKALGQSFDASDRGYVKEALQTIGLIH